MFIGHLECFFSAGEGGLNWAMKPAALVEIIADKKHSCRYTHHKNAKDGGTMKEHSNCLSAHGIQSTLKAPPSQQLRLAAG